jgi:hypothetical protein
MPLVAPQTPTLSEDAQNTAEIRRLAGFTSDEEFSDDDLANMPV